MKTETQKTKTSQVKRTVHGNKPSKVPFIEHWHELRRRLFYVAMSVLGWSLAAYAVQQHIVNVLIRPSHGQSFVYTSPIGGIDFLFRLTLYTGLILSIPVIIYNLLKFIAPLMRQESTRFILTGSLASFILAAAGIVFGYYIGLPAALHFLLHQFTTGQIRPLITIQSYMSFVMVYMVGAALMFQVPLLVIFINRITPLKPSGLIHYERWVILLAFVMAGLMNPTPNLFSQLIVAGPIILLYQFSIGLIWLMNARVSRRRKTIAPSLGRSAMAVPEEEPPVAPKAVRLTGSLPTPQRQPRLIMDVF